MVTRANNLIPRNLCTIATANHMTQQSSSHLCQFRNHFPYLTIFNFPNFSLPIVYGMSMIYDIIIHGGHVLAISKDPKL